MVLLLDVMALVLDIAMVLAVVLLKKVVGMVLVIYVHPVIPLVILLVNLAIVSLPVIQPVEVDVRLHVDRLVRMGVKLVRVDVVVVKLVVKVELKIDKS